MRKFKEALTLKKEKKNKKSSRAAKIIVGTLLAILALIVIAFAVIWIISPELFTFIITFVIPNLPKLLTGNNMKAAWIMFTSDNAAIVEQIDVHQQNKSDTLGISAEVLAAIESGNYTEEEIARILDTKGEAIAEIDAAKLASAEGSNENTENADGVDEVLDELSPEVLSAIESGKYTEEEITRIIESKGEAISEIDAEKAKQPEKEQESPPVEPEKTPEPEKKPDPEKPAVNTDTPVNDTQSSQSSPEVKPSQPEIPTESPTETTPTQPAEPETVTPPESETPEEAVTPTTPTVNTAEIVNKHVAKLYIVKNRFVSELGSMEKTIRKQYVSLPKEQQVPTSRKEIAKQYISFVADLELECDAEVESILSALKTELEAVGGDLGIIDAIRTQYEEEKSLKKAYYLDIYMNGLPDKVPASDTASSAG